MRTVRRIASFGASFLLVGCALHPLPDDVTGRSTFQIVQKIRCEARDALIEISADVLQNSTTDPYTNELSKMVRARSVKVTDVFDWKKEYARRVDRKVFPYFTTFALSALALGFTLDITETNDAQAEGNFQDPFSQGIFKLGAKAGNKYERNTKRRFIVGETFLELYVSLDQRNGMDPCATYASGQNFIYPITGNVGLKEVFEAFINLNSHSIDPALPRVRGEKPDSVALFVDTLRFTTTLTAGATPKVELTPAPASKRFNLVNAQLGMTAQRQDLHQVEISLQPGQPVSSLEEAYRKVKIEGGTNTMAAIRKLQLNRTDGLLEDIRRRLDEPRL